MSKPPRWDRHGPRDRRRCVYDKKFMRSLVLLPNEKWKVPSAHSQCSSSELNLLYNIPRLIGDGAYLNLGCFRGASTIALAFGVQDFCKSGHVYTIDKWSRPRFKVDAISNFEKNGLSKLITPIRGLTTTIPDILKEQKFQFVFIDASHTYEDCKADLETWKPFVEKGGHIGFHDCHMDTVWRVTRELVSQGWEQSYAENLLRCFTKK